MKNKLKSTQIIQFALLESNRSYISQWLSTCSWLIFRHAYVKWTVDTNHPKPMVSKGFEGQQFNYQIFLKILDMIFFLPLKFQSVKKQSIYFYFEIQLFRQNSPSREDKYGVKMIMIILFLCQSACKIILVYRKLPMFAMMQEDFFPNTVESFFIRGGLMFVGS